MKPNMNILELPQDCISQILSLTSPWDVVRSSAVSKQFLSVSTLDPVWDNFLPSDLDDIISTSSSVIPRGSKKELFMYLSDFPILLENNTQSFALDKRSGKICYMLGSRALSIVWGSSPEYWRWLSIPESRFPECAVLRAVCWLEIKGRIHTRLLSQDTPYGVYFVFKIKVGTFTGFGETLVKGSVSVISEDGLPLLGDQRTAEIKSFSLVAPRLDIETDRASRWMSCNAGFEESEEEEQESQAEESEEEDEEEPQDEESVEEDEEESQNEESEKEDPEESRAELLVTREESDDEAEDQYSSRELLVTREESEEEAEENSSRALLVSQDEESEEEDEEEFVGELPVARSDGWMEIELGRYQVGLNDVDEGAVLEMSLKEVEKLYWKNGLAVYGIEIRPLS